MPGIEPTSARNWDDHWPALGTLTCHRHVKISVLSKLLVPPDDSGLATEAALWGCLGPLFAVCCLICPNSAAQGDGLCWESGTRACAQEPGLGLRGIYQMLLGIPPWICHGILCGLGSKLPHSLIELWVDRKRAGGMETLVLFPRLPSVRYWARQFNAQGSGFLINKMRVLNCTSPLPQGLAFCSVVLTVFLEGTCGSRGQKQANTSVCSLTPPWPTEIKHLRISFWLNQEVLI